MKINNKVLLLFLIISLLILIMLLSKEAIKYKKEYLLTTNPLTELKILNQDITLNKMNRNYKNNIDCSNLNNNEQIVSYKLNSDYKVTVNIKIFKDNTILKDNLEEATSIETHLLIKDKNNKHEQIFIIESTCQQGEIS